MDLRRQLQDKAMMAQMSKPMQNLPPSEQQNAARFARYPINPRKHLQERRYFDSGDYALAKAGKANAVDTGNIGSEHPVPEKIPHLSSPVGSVQTHHQHHPSIHGQASSPVKETSFLSQETNAEELEGRSQQENQEGQPGQQKEDAEGLPIRS